MASPTPEQIAAAQTSDLSKANLVEAREFLKILDEIHDRGERRVAVEARVNELLAKSVAYIKDRLEELKKEQDLLQATEKLYANRNELLRRHNEIGDNNLKILQNTIELAKEDYEGNKQKLLDLIEQNKEKLKGIDLSKIEGDEKDRTIAQARIIVGLKEKENEAAKRAGEQTKAIISATTGVSDSWKNTLVGSLMEGGSEGITKSGLALKDTFSSANIAGSLLMKVQESTIMMVKMADTTFATFNKTIGTTGELNNEIYDLSRNNTLLGFTLQETAQSYTALAGGFVDFRGLSQQNRVELAQTVTELQAIGINADLATKNISFFSKAMGLSTEQSISLSKELVAVAGALEMAPSKIASDFAAAASTLVVYGNRAVEVFKGLEAASKASGVEISNLISIASKMDTFQGAAEAAGKLNAVLGGGLLNSSQLLMASEEERIRLVIESVQSQGVQFNDLDKYTQKAIANAAGITDMAEANKLFGMSVGAYDDYIAKTAVSSEEQADLEKRIQASKSAQEKFNYIMQAFAVLVMPILDFVTMLVDGFMALNDTLGGSLPLILTITALISKFFGIMSFLSAIGPIIEIIGGVFALLGQAIPVIGVVFEAIGVALMSVGSALTGPVLAAILAVVGGFYLAYKAFFDTNSALYKFLETNSYLKFVLGAMLAPFIMIIGAIKGMYLIVTDMDNAWKHLRENLIYISPLFTGIAKALEYFGIIAHTENSPKLYTLAEHMAAGFSKFANVITSLAIPALNMFLAPLRMVGSIMSGVWSGISTIVGATSSLFGKENVVGIKANFDATEALATTAAKITPDSMTNVKQLAAEVQKFNMELKTMATVTASEPLMNLVKAITGQTNAMTDGTKDKTIVLKVGEREFGKIVLDIINKKGNIDTAVKSTSTVT